MSDEPSQVIARHRDHVLALPGVTGIAWGLSPTQSGQRRILIYGSEGTEVPATLEHLPVELVVSREFHAQRRTSEAD